MATTPGGRKKKISGQAGDVNKRDEGLHSGPVGSSHGYSGRPSGKEGKDEDKGLLTDLLINSVSTNTSNSQSSGSNSGGLFGGLTGSSGSSSHSGSNSSSGGLFKGKGILILIVIAVLVFGGGGLGGLFGGGDDTTSQNNNNNIIATTPAPTQSNSSTGTLFSSLGLSDLFGGSSSSGSSYSFDGAATSAGWGLTPNTSKLNTSVASGARAKRTSILGNSRDVVTIMVYMCGTDLESQYGMGTADLKEMVSASISSNINLIVYTGGCKKWRVNGISNTNNQIWQIKNGQLHQLESNAGTGAMTDPKTLTTFIQYCKSNFPANRNMLIFWDHGGGSLSGYGYDERNTRSGSMDLTQIKQALTNGGVIYDFIGFDACLHFSVS